MKILTRKHFKSSTEPWAGLQLDTADTQRVAAMVEAAVRHQAMVSVLGARGVGKTCAIRYALQRSPDVRVVEPLRLTRDKLHMGDIEIALVRDLSNESPKRSAETRSQQVQRVLGHSSIKQRIVLMIDDAHMVHGNTLRALKRL